MVAHLHPRSRSTLSLFSSCLAISFLVVAAPHVLPCPVDRTQHSDSAPSSDQPGEPTRRRRRRKPTPTTTPSPDNEGLEQETYTPQDQFTGSKKRECPVPKPGGLIGQVMGFSPQERQPRPTVIVQTLRDRHARDNAQSTSGNETP